MAILKKLLQAKEMTTKLFACLIDYTYLVIQNYKMIAIDLSKQQAFSADPKAIQQTDFTGNRERAENTKMFFIIEELKDTSHKQLRKYCKRVL